jgi:signal transduction histidine kinase
VDIDKKYFKTILDNLLENGVKFSKENSSIFVNAIVKDDSVEFSVKDEGVGISPEIQPKIFKPFYQGEESIYRKFGGLGLGLAICNGLIGNMGGRIWFKTDSKKGSTFYFTIPLRSNKLAKKSISKEINSE